MFSGGGARAYAHLGVLRAFHESDIPIDFIGGTSMGAIVAACLAMGWSLKELQERIRQSFAETSPLTDYSLPLVGLVRGVKVETLLAHHFGKTRIEDLWLPFFCVSSNLTTARAEVHRAGLLPKALRASVSLPGILPPVVTARGLLVDGGVVNNLPVDIMRETNRGPVVAVDVARDLALTPAWLKQEMARPLIQRLLRPPLVSILMRAGTVSGEQQYRTQIQTADAVIAPALGAIDLRDWRASRSPSKRAIWRRGRRSPSTRICCSRRPCRAPSRAARAGLKPHDGGLACRYAWVASASTSRWSRRRLPKIACAASASSVAVPKRS